jgi:hypothetical protein
MKKMQIRFNPDTRTLTIDSRVIHLNKAETAAIAEAGNPFVIPRINALIAALQKLNRTTLSRAMTAKAQHATYTSDGAHRGNHTARQWTEIVDTPDGPVKVRTSVRCNRNNGYTITTVVRMDPRTNLLTHTVTKHRPPAAPVTTHKTYRSISRIRLTTHDNAIDRRMVTRKQPDTPKHT